MAFTRPTLPFKLTPEDMGRFNAPKAVGQGTSVVDEMIKTKLNHLKAKTAEAELPYAGLSKMAQSASQLAYATFVAPQFMAKLLQNPDFVANSSPEQINAIQSALAKAMGQNPVNSIQNMAGGGQGGGQPNPAPPANNPNPNAPNPSTTGTPSGQDPDSGYSHTRATDQEVEDKSNEVSPDVANGGSNIPLSTYENYGKRALNRSDIPGIPGSVVVNENEPGMSNVHYAKGKPLENEKPVEGWQPDPKKSYQENAVNYAAYKDRQESKNKELGKGQGEAVTELGKQNQSEAIKQNTYGELNKVLYSPEMASSRKIPAAGGYELSYIQRYGSPEQQKAVAKARTLMGNIIKDASRDFAGQFRRGEQQLLERMKPSDSDTLDAMRAKTRELNKLSMFLSERNKKTADYIQNGDMSPIDAQVKADKDMKGYRLEIVLDRDIKQIEKDNKIAQKMREKEYSKKMIDSKGNPVFVHNEDYEYAKTAAGGGYKDAT